MKITKLRFTKEASNRLRFAAGKTGLTPNNVTADASGRVGIFPLDLPELLHDAADSG